VNHLLQGYRESRLHGATRRVAALPDDKSASDYTRCCKPITRRMLKSALETRLPIAFSGGHVSVIDQWKIENGKSGSCINA
jgi:hypothetical protein